MVDNVELTTQQETEKYKPSIVAIIGLPLTGKSTFGRSLSDKSNFTFLDVDYAREEIFPPETRGVVFPGQGEAFAMINSYQRNHEIARDSLEDGKPVILAATYSRPIYHEMLKDLALKQSVPLKVVLLSCSDEEIQKRINRRNEVGDTSNVRSIDHYRKDQGRYEKITGVDILEIDTEQPVDENLSKIIDFIKDLKN